MKRYAWVWIVLALLVLMAIGIYSDNDSSGSSNSSSNSNSNSNSSSNSSSKHYCEECGKSASYSIKGITGKTEHYCYTHYKEMKEMWDILNGN